MTRAARNTIAIILALCGVGILAFSIFVYPQPFAWGTFISLFVPTVFVGLVALLVSWGVAAGMTWRDVMELVTDIWRQ